jgi:hypothetical protein
MQLREELVPYLYTLAGQAYASGLPMAQALYLDYPGQAAAYTSPAEYLLGPSMLVAPVTQPGATVSQQVWFPPGTWQDYSTGATFTGPATATISVPDSRMPVFVKEGGIIPLQPANGSAQTAGTAPITLQVHAGASGSLSLYDDSGTGLGYQSGQASHTPVTYTENAGSATSTLTIGPATGSYPGEPASRSYIVSLIDESQPTSVQVNGQTLASTGWSYDSTTHTLRVPVGAVGTGSTATVTQSGGTPQSVTEPASAAPPLITSVTSGPVAAGQQVTVTGSGFGASQGGSYLTFGDNGTNWGAPGDLASFTVNSWSDTSVTFTVPSPSGTGGQWAITPGTTGTVAVTTGDGNSNATPLAVGATTGAVTGSAGLCLDDRNAATTDDNPIQVYTCNGTNAQQWTRASGGALQVLGKCLDVNGGDTTNNTVVDLYDCNGTGAQVWVPQPAGDLVNPQSGKCLEDPGSGGSGTQLVIYDCTGSAAEQWRLP